MSDPKPPRFSFVQRENARHALEVQIRAKQDTLALVTDENKTYWYKEEVQRDARTAERLIKEIAELENKLSKI